MARLRNPHPGEILREEFLNAIGMSQNQLTRQSHPRHCQWKAIFLRLQNAYDTLEAKRRIAEQVAKIKPYKPGKAA